jgi:hypothetical protein
MLLDSIGAQSSSSQRKLNNIILAGGHKHVFLPNCIKSNEIFAKSYQKELQF